MDWKMASFMALGFWGTYVLFGNAAGKVHGEKVSMLFEAVAMLLVAVLSLSAVGALHDFAKVTPRSFVFAVVMGLLSAGGLYVQLYALRTAPGQVSLIALITGMWPVVTVVIIGIAGFLGFNLGDKLLPRQWIGVLLAAAGLMLVNWGK